MKLNLGSMIISCCLVFLVGCSATPEKGNFYSGKVTRVLSGQTVEVQLTGTSEVVKLRIEGINAPDWRQDPWAAAAQKKLQDLVLDQTIAIETDETENLERDRYSRIQGHLWRGQTLISQQLVESGYVLINDRSLNAHSQLLRSSQEYARLMGYGIWNPQQAMRYTPSQFRLQNKQ
ncbi:MAG: thermonuclease family protein [Cyanobacteria bacterium J06600_6]